MDLPERVRADIVRLAARHGIKQAVLFGSRARGDNRERSDIDLAAAGGDVDGFRVALDEEAETLLRFDVVELGAALSADLRAEIEKDGITSYEEIRQL